MLAVLAAAGTVTGVVTDPAFAVDTGVGRRAAAVAQIDPTSAVIGSTQIRSFPGQEGDTGMVQLFRFETDENPIGDLAVATSPQGTYIITPLAVPLAAGENVYVKNLGLNAASATVIVQPAAPPSISGPLNPGNPSVTGHATPGRTVAIRDAITGVTLGNSTTVAGDGAFSITVPALRMFQAIRAEDNEDLSSATATVLGFSAVTNAGIPSAPCPATVVQPSGPQIIRFECGLLHPRGVSVLPDSSLRVLAGVPPSGLINYPPPATFKFDPATQVAEMLSPVTGVAMVYVASVDSLFIARPHLFRLQEEHMVERHDGEILQMDPDTGVTTVATRLLDIAPTGIAADTSVPTTFGGGAVVSSLFQDTTASSPADPGGASAIWRVSLAGEVSPLSIQASPALTRIQGLAVGLDWNGAPALFAAQPGSGTIFRILPDSGAYTAAPLVSGLGSPIEVAVAPTGLPFGGDLYATDADGGRVLRITVGVGGTSTVQNYVTGLTRPFGLAFSATGLFVTEYSGDIVAIYP